MDCYFVGTKMGVSNRVLSVVALVVCAVCGAILWRAHVSAVNDAVDAERDRLMLDFEREKGAAVKRESDRAKGIIEAVKGGYENELKTIQARADRLLADRNAGACQSPPIAQPSEATQAALNQIPARLLQKQEPNFLPRLSSFLSEKPVEPTKRSTD